MILIPGARNETSTTSHDERAGEPNSILSRNYGHFLTKRQKERRKRKKKKEKKKKEKYKETNLK